MKNPKTAPSGRTKLWQGAEPVKDAPKPRVETPADVERKEQEAHAKPWPKLPTMGRNLAHGGRNYEALIEKANRQRSPAYGKRNEERWGKR